MGLIVPTYKLLKVTIGKIIPLLTLTKHSKYWEMSCGPVSSRKKLWVNFGDNLNLCQGFKIPPIYTVCYAEYNKINFSVLG